MNKDILDYYERELGYLKREGALFAENYPAIASHLRLNENDIEDPHVSRLLEGVAFLNAKIHQRLDDDFNQLSDALLNQLYPHYQDPIPSFSVVQFVPPSGQEQSVAIKAGTQLETRPPDDTSVYFTTLQDVVMEPFLVREAQLQSRPFNAPGSHVLPHAESLLKLSLQADNDSFTFQQLDHSRIRFFIRAPFRLAASLLELLAKDCLGVIATQSELDTRPVLLPPDVIKPLGFSDQESLLPYRQHAQAGYRLLSEYFLFPEKFLFFEIDISHIQAQLNSSQLHLHIYFRNQHLDLERLLNADYFALNCTPVINLFKEVSEPIRLDHTQFEYELLPSLNYPKSTEVIQIDAVEAVATDTNLGREVLPFFALNHDRGAQGAANFFWHSRRQTAPHHSHLLLSVTDLDLNQLDQTNFTLYANMLCSNGNLPEALPFGGGQPHFYSGELTIPLTEIRCLVAPTQSVRQATEKSARWKLISHLNLNLLSLNNSAQALLAFKEMLRLYDFQDSSSTRALINSLLQLRVTPCVAAVQFGIQTCMARGLDIELEVDEAGFAGSNLFIFGQVIQHFFALYCSINSFTRLTLKVQGKEGIFHQWNPVIGERSLL